MSGSDLLPPNFPADRLVFRGDTVTLELAGRGREIPFRIDPAANPKAIDLTFPGEDAARTGIYALDGYALILCLNTRPDAARPAAFASAGRPDLGLLLLTCQRERY
jgi:uncharacterized protein (TIGR03067 family)